MVFEMLQDFTGSDGTIYAVSEWKDGDRSIFIDRLCIGDLLETVDSSYEQLLRPLTCRFCLMEELDDLLME